MSRYRIVVGSAAVLVATAAAATPGDRHRPPEFDAFFVEKTMRVDYYHTGGMGSEIVSLDRVVSDGPWAGSRSYLLDDTDLGAYLFEVHDVETTRIIYSRGYATLYGEWEATSEAQRLHRTFHESVRFPWPREPVRIVLKKRGVDNRFVEFATLFVDPRARSVNRADPPVRGDLWTVMQHGDPQDKVDIVLLGVGYTAQEMTKFHTDARRITEALFSYDPYRSRRGDFNVRAIDLPAEESGVTRPHAAKYRRNLVGTQYSVFDSERYALAVDNRTLREVLSAVPYEAVGILVNEKQYGGGGIFNYHAAAATGSAFAEYLFVHEFGHHFAALADEYYTSPVAYETGSAEHVEPWEPNVTALHDPATLKWRDLVTTGTPIPTPWDKQKYEKHARDIQAQRQKLIDAQAPEEQFDALFRHQREIELDMLGSMEHTGHVGAFEGASYEATGLYRPEIDCIMFTRNMVRFCAVCQRAIERVIDLYATPNP
jgi:hypothetical protein